MPLTYADVVLEVPGGSAELEANLRARLRLMAESCDAPAWRVRRLFQQAERDLTPALRAFGYYRPKIEKQLSTAEACWQAQLQIDPGERVQIRRRTVRLRGAAADDTEFKTLLADLPLADDVPVAFGSVPTGPRSVSWRDDAPATLAWVEARDGGDAAAPADVRDELFMLDAPFTGDPVSLAIVPRTVTFRLTH